MAGGEVASSRIPSSIAVSGFISGGDIGDINPASMFSPVKQFRFKLRARIQLPLSLFFCIINVIFSYLPNSLQFMFKTLSILVVS